MKFNKKDLFILILIIIALSGIILNRNLGDLDEIWNYNFARNIYEGRVPYKDFNMIQMPLLPIIASIFLRIIGNELIVMRILAILLCSTILFISYKILKELNISKNFCIIAILFIGYLLKDYFCIDYNFAILLNILIIILLEIRFLKNNSLVKANSKYDFFIGLLAGMCITYKQTTGIIVSLLCLGYKFLLCENKENFKEYLKIFLLRLIGVIIPIRNYFIIFNM